jgi:2-polyprenyl-3-methyl-5-hydroxy-6-metoxy-1,4-benzoquinol methylase
VKEQKSKKDAATMNGHLPYTNEYFASQISKSNLKIHTQYGRIFSLAGITPAGRILDIGCGAGPGLRYLTRYTPHVFGVDLVAYPLTEAQKLTRAAGLVQADVAYTLPFADQSFDIVLLSELIEHLRNSRPLIFECYRVLRPGGTVIITTPNLRDIRRTLAPMLGKPWSGDTDPTHINLQDPEHLTGDMISARFQRVRWHSGIKPMFWLSSRRLNMRLPVPYPPHIGNGLVAVGVRQE